MPFARDLRCLRTSAGWHLQGDGRIALHEGGPERARDLRAKAEALDPSHRWSTWMKGSIAGRSGDKQGGLDAIGEIEKK